MATDSINGLEPEAIEEELHALIRAHFQTGEMPDGMNGSVSDSIYEELEGSIPMMADILTQVESVPDAETKIGDYLEDLVFDAAKNIDEKYDDKKLYRYIDVFVGEIGGIMLELGFDTANVED